MWYVSKMKDADKSTFSMVIERQSPGLKDTLWRLIQEAKGGDLLAPVTVVGPSRYANLSLRQELGRNGFANVQFLVLPALSEVLGAPGLARAGRRPLTPVLEGVSIREILSRATGPLAPVAAHPSTQYAVRTAFRELRRASDDELAAWSSTEAFGGEVAQLYRSFRENMVTGWYDAEDLAEAATEAVETGDMSGLDEHGMIVFYLPRSVSPAETRLVEAGPGRPLRRRAGRHRRRRS